MVELLYLLLMPSLKQKVLPPLIAAGTGRFDAVAAGGGGDSTAVRFAP